MIWLLLSLQSFQSCFHFHFCSRCYVHWQADRFWQLLPLKHIASISTFICMFTFTFGDLSHSLEQNALTFTFRCNLTLFVLSLSFVLLLVVKCSKCYVQKQSDMLADLVGSEPFWQLLLLKHTASIFTLLLTSTSTWVFKVLYAEK